MLNKLILIGNVTKDVELKKKGDKAYAKISFAVQRNYANTDGERDVDFFETSVFDKRAESCSKYLKKGSKIAVVGALQNHNYEDDKGNKRYTNIIRCEEVEFLSAQKKQEDKQEEKPKPKMDKLEPIEDDDLPF